MRESTFSSAIQRLSHCLRLDSVGSFSCETGQVYLQNESISKDLLKLNLVSKGFTIYAEAKIYLIKNGLSYIEVPFEHIGRKYEKNKDEKLIKSERLKDLEKLKSLDKIYF
jgi:hypothetical protein